MSSLYFAYGSNLHPRRLAQRAPSCRAETRAYLSGHALRFHKRSVDGSGKCDARHTGRDSDRVLGALFHIDPADRPSLDVAEHLGHGYDLRQILVTTDRGPVDAYTYIAMDDFVIDGLRPFDWYKSYVVLGARFHGLPEPYVETLERHRSVVDTDRKRSDPHWSRIDLMRAEMGL